MSPTQRSSQPEVSNAVPETLETRMTPENSAPGDTQPVSPSVYESMIKKSRSPLESADAQQEDYGNTGDGVTQLTLIEGDTGHIDLLDGFGGIQAGDDIEIEADCTSNFGNSSPARFQPNQFPESQRFISKTPATVKRRNRGDDTPAETPSLPINPLAPNGGYHSGGQTMALSQAFKATQAPSSPFVNGLTSDALSDRPSPNIPIQNRPVAASASSPFLAYSPVLRSGTNEPQTNYVSMKESQAMRQRLAEQRKTRSASDINRDDMSDDGFDKEDSLVQRRAFQKAIREETRRELMGVTAPARPKSKDKGKKPGVSEHSQNIATVHGDTAQVETVIVSDAEDGFPATDNGAPSEEETEQEEDLDRPVNLPSNKPTSSCEEDKENFDDPTSQAHTALSEALDRNSPVRRNIFADTLPMATQQTKPGDENEQLLQRNSQDINVADSQPNHENSLEWQSSTLPNNLQTSSITPLYRPPKSQLERSHDAQRKSYSPVIKSRLPSSPPTRDEHNREQGAPDLGPADESQQIYGNGSGSHSEKCTNSNNVDQQGQKEADNSLTATEKKTKPREDVAQVNSSLSRVVETPIHNNPRPRSFRNTIPETSPASQGDNDLVASAVDTFLSQKTPSALPDPAPDNDNDNDMLPPPYNETEHLHATALQRSPAGRRLSQAAAILSSPSGRQRRKLTQIASDPPPEDPSSDVDMDIGLVTKEDNDFRSIVGDSPIRQKKRRRGNDGKGIVTTRMVPIKPPCEPTPTTKPVETREKRAERPAPEDTGIQEIPVLRRSRPANQTENIWDVETSPQKKAVPTKTLRRSRSSGNISSRRSRLSEPVNRSDRMSAAQGVVIPTRKSLQAASTRKAESVPRDSPDPIQADTPISNRDTEQDVLSPAVPSNDTVVAPNQIFGCYNGRKRAYYPAVCLDTVNLVGKSGYVIKLEDTDADEVDANAVKRLELRIGDVVKVDMPDVPKVPHVIRGLKDKVDPDTISQPNPDDPELPYQMTDVYGYSTVLLGPKQRKSLPRNPRSKLISAPISKIYLDTVLWAQLKDRKFTYSPESGTSFSRLGSPISRYATPVPQTSRTNQTPLPTTGMFAGMVFAITYIRKEEIKSRVTSLIERNGGHILQDGFQELFRFSASVPTATPKKSATSKYSNGNSDSHFQLTPSAENIGFVALIADQHSRRAKYMQALALNIPCLSGRWIEDCIQRNEVLDWEHYLLPAGESKLLHGAIRSRIMAPNPATTARFAETFAARPKLLDGQSVLLVVGRGKAEEKRKAYLFLTYALGADKVERVLDLKDAKTALSQEGRDQRASQGSQGSQHPSGWDWVYVDDQEEATAREMLPGVYNPKSTKPRPEAGKKRRRSERAASVASSFGESSEGGIRVVGNEFVCQSLILGKLFEE